MPSPSSSDERGPEVIGSRDGDGAGEPLDPGSWLRAGVGDAALTVSNEFARVRVRADRDGNDLRLAIRSLRTGREVFLDALQLESLTWLDDSAYTALLTEPFGPQ
ncbi:hypothetical protein GCU67_13660 [Modestobacter muralis]|uniref:Dihydrodiol dehydrogenase n=1 Tax=Modestobacter muralis TaxID=1608614 RepID=A0A6P0EZE3_9ACTN|nr:hypothetical protein [Modestobacter muralis]NEK95204.1 hypothetical protein [Modestobacter muralis]NEN52092.1 hypothetical protein [Modestobacter muralis]